MELQRNGESIENFPMDATMLRIVQIILLSLLIINSAANYEDKLQSVFCTADKYGKVIACGGDHPQLS